MSELHYDSAFGVGEGESGITPIRDNPDTNGRQNTQDETTDGFLNVTYLPFLSLYRCLGQSITTTPLEMQSYS